MSTSHTLWQERIRNLFVLGHRRIASSILTGILPNSLRRLRSRARRHLNTRSERLEERALLTVASVVNGSLLTVTLTNASDVVISEAGGLLKINGADTTAPTNASSISEIRVIGGAGDNAIDLAGVSTNSFPSITRVVVNAGAGNDNVLGSQIRDELHGGDGNDFMVGNAGHDEIHGDGGDDALLGAAGSDILFGGEGNDSVLGQGASGDFISGGPGIDFIDGGPGKDTLVENVAGVFSVDNFLAVNSTSGEIDTLHRVENASITGSDGPDNISAAALIGVATIHGGLGNDVLTGTEFEDFLDGFVGADVLAGRGGNDTIIAGGGHDTLTGGPGDDFFRGNGGHDLILGGTGNDVMNGLAGNDTLEGDAGDDSMFGGDGIDVLRAAAGNDFADAEGGNDLVTGGDGNDVLVGSVGDDIVDGGTGDDFLFGGSGRDQLLGREGNDFIKGQGSSRDSVSGGPGTDNIIGLLSEIHENQVFESPWLSDRVLPTFTIGLANDTGADGDGITFDSTLAGSVSSVAFPATGELRIGGRRATFSVDAVTSDYQIEAATIEAIPGVADGTQNVVVAIVDANGEVTTNPYSFELDRQGPKVESFSPDNLSTVTDLRSATFTFDESIDTSSVEAIDFVMTDLGNDGLPDTGDESNIEINRIEVTDNSVTVFPTIALFSRSYEISLLDSSVSDLVGNTSGNGASIQFNNIDTTVRWVGGNGDWSHGSNWSTGSSPQNGDRVVIGVGNDVSVNFNSSVQLKSLSLQGSLNITGGALSLTEPSYISGGLTMDRAELTVSGSDAGLTIDGASTINESDLTINNGANFIAPNLTALTESVLIAEGDGTYDTPSVADITDTRFHISDGAQLSMPLVLSYDTSSNGPLESELIIVDGANSVLDLSNATAFRDSFGGWFQPVARTIEATNGGMIDFSGLVTIEGPQKDRDRLELTETNGSRIEYRDLQTITAGSVRLGLSGVGRALNHLTTAESVGFHLAENTTVDVPLLTSVTGDSIEVRGNAALNLPAVTSLADSQIRMTSSSSVLETPEVVNADNVQIHLSGGAQYTLPVLTLDLSDISIEDSGALMIVEGLGSYLDLSSVTTFGDGFNGWIQPLDRVVTVRDRGVIDLSGVTTLQGPNTSRDTLQLSASGGGKFKLDALQQTTGGMVGLKLSGVQQVVPQLQTVAAISIDLADGAQAVLPDLTTIDSGTITVASNSTVTMPKLTTMNFTTVTLSGSGSKLLTPQLENADNSRFFLSGGAGYTLTVETYDVSDVARLDETIIRVEGAGSQLNMSTVLTLKDAFPGAPTPIARYIEAIDGGQIDLSMLQSVEGPTQSTDRLQLSMSSGGLIMLSQLQNQVGGPIRIALDGVTTTVGNLVTASALQIEVTSGGRFTAPNLMTVQSGSIFVGSNSNVSLPVLQTLNQATVTLQDSSSNLGISNVSNIDNSRFFLSGGARLTMSGVTNYDISGIDSRQIPVIIITGSGSRLQINQVQSLNATFPGASTTITHQILASDGGQLSATNLSSISGPTDLGDLLTIGIEGTGRIFLANSVMTSGNLAFLVDQVNVGLAAFQAAN